MAETVEDFFVPTVHKMASLSLCKTFRYRLTRYWGPGRMLPFVMLNPSTADSEVDDPTIRRCMGFARREGAGGIVVGNLCALRSPSPAALDRAADPCGPANQRFLWEIAIGAKADDMPVVCAWGTHGKGRDRSALEIFASENVRLVCLGTTADGYPRHPLYIKGDQPLIPFSSTTQGTP